MASSPQTSFFEQLHRKLMASNSATAVLREVYGGPVEIERLSAGCGEAGADIVALLGVGGRSAIVSREVRLRAGGAVVSEAMLHYVPSRLLPGMADTLLRTNTPFGAVVAAMQPTRETMFVRFYNELDRIALVHHAVLKDRLGEPIACVLEQYLRHVSPRHAPEVRGAT